MQVKIQKTCSFKLGLDKEQMKEWDNHFYQFGRAVNGYLKIITEIRNNYKPLNRKEQFSGKCIVCGSETTIEFISRDGMEKFCRKCYNLNFGNRMIRRKVYPSRGRKVEDKRNIKNYASLSKTEYNTAYYDAMAVLKSKTQKDRSTEQLLKRLSARLKKFVEIRDDETKRYTKPREPKQRVDRFCHKIDLERKIIRYYTMSEINKKIEDIEKLLKKIEKREGSFPVFSGKSMTLHNKMLNFKNDVINIKMGDRWCSFEVLGDYQKELFEKAKSQKIIYPHIVKKNDNYYLEYPITETVDLPTPDSTFKAMGIDRGVNKILASSVLDSIAGKPHSVSFISGRDLMHRKKVYELMREAFYHKRHGYRKVRRTSGKIKNYTKYLVHKISRDIVNQAKGMKPIVIVLEDIKNIRDTAGKGKTKRVQKTENKMLSNFIYGIVQKYVIYKAILEGIPVVKVDPYLTSQICNKCGNSNPDNRNGSNFKCLKCGYSANADYNASVNIAKRYYENLKTTTLTFDEKENIYKFVQRNT